ncbi:MAG: GTPase RsgA [Mollicutes bacterium]|nr:GTPase RsgA [Mollicutes bacterium]
MIKCKGCGITLDNDKYKFCQRCFKIKNYNNHEIESIIIDNDTLLKNINKKKVFTLFLCDFLSINKKNVSLYNKITNEKIFIVTKMDTIPKNINIDKLANNIVNIYKINDMMYFSYKNGFGKNEILNLIKDRKVLITGPTNSGKSSLINYLFNTDITVSNYKNTTQDFINIGNIIDAPGFNDDNLYDNIKQNGYIKPRTINIKKGYELIIEDIIISFLKDSKITLYIPDNILAKTKKSLLKPSTALNIVDKSDLVLNNMGFIYFKEKSTISCNINMEIRKSII